MATKTQQRGTVGIDAFASWVEQASTYLQREGDFETARISRCRETLRSVTLRELSSDHFLDEFSQAVACGRFAAGFDTSASGTASLPADVAHPLIAEALLTALAAWPQEPETARNANAAAELAQLYEPFLRAHHQHRRSRNGVYYTPQELANYVVGQTDSLLRSEFGLADGLADITTWSELRARNPHIRGPETATASDPFVRILDPAVGGGVFLVAAIESIYQTLRTRAAAEQLSDKQFDEMWQAYVPRHLLPRLCGLELMLPAAVVAHLQVYHTLVKTGYCFSGHERIRIYLADTLADLPATESRATANPSELSDTRKACRDEPFTVLLGNPPFSGISRNNGHWITELLRGREQLPGGPTETKLTGSYYRANGQPLAEKKLWLQDDYVKFLRYAQWQIERTGAGIVGFVTNHGYLDNVTFRGMREQLRTAFPRISVLDLHGSAKKKERSPDGSADENVFGIESGVAVGLLRKPLKDVPPCVDHGDLWGTRADKLRCLSFGIKPLLTVTPTAPFHFFTPHRNEFSQEYLTGWLLTDAMPVNSTVAVTARDSFVIAFDRNELLQRMAIFRDLRISDDEIRSRFFFNSRSTRYPPGDTRGWKLTAARQRMADDPDWKQHIQPCLYRPFDRRWIYWADWMIDWPRSNVNQHVTKLDNLVLIARRQMLPTHPCNFFWVTRMIPIDGVIRSDNRGSESAFPLWLNDQDDGTGAEANFEPDFAASVAEATDLEWDPSATCSAADAFGPADLLRFIYGQFYSAEFRLRYAAGLRIDFPRIFIPRTASLFRQLSTLGGNLIAAQTTLENQKAAAGTDTDAGKAIQPGYPKWRRDEIQLGLGTEIVKASQATWEFQAGGHQVCRKWWRDRTGRRASKTDFSLYQQLVRSVQSTIELASQVDRSIEAHGGWPDAFLGNAPSNRALATRPGTAKST